MFERSLIKEHSLREDMDYLFRVVPRRNKEPKANGKELRMSAPNHAGGSGSGCFGLPLYGALTFFSSLEPQPDPNTHLKAWSRFVTTDSYVLKHLFLSILGVVFGIFGTFALGAYLAGSRAGRLGLVAMVMTVLGSAPVPDLGRSLHLRRARGGAGGTWRARRVQELPIIFANHAGGDRRWRRSCSYSWATCSSGSPSGVRERYPGGQGPSGLPRPCSCTSSGCVYAMTIGAQATPPTVPAGAVLLGDKRGVDGLERPAPSLGRNGGLATPNPRVQ